ncbi:MAG: hypothetical protein QXE05_05250 [Nitrososphaeria archaeon]
MYNIDYRIEGRCVICGEHLNDPTQLCSWCGDPNLEESLKALIYEVEDRMQQMDRIDIKAEPVFSLIADMGLLGLRHKLLTSFTKALATLILESARTNRLSLRKIQYGQRNVEQFILLLQDLNFVNYNRNIREISIPDGSIFYKIRHEVEIEPRRNPAAAFILGYIVLKVLLRTIETIKGGEKITFGEGITLLYSLTSKDDKIKVMMPKGFTAALVFILGHLSRGFVDFSEIDLRKFMNERGVTGKEFETILATYTCAFASVHALFERAEVQSFGRLTIYWFRLNSEYTRIYERIRERRVTRGE